MCVPCKSLSHMSSIASLTFCLQLYDKFGIVFAFAETHDWNQHFQESCRPSSSSMALRTFFADFLHLQSFVVFAGQPGRNPRSSRNQRDSSWHRWFADEWILCIDTGDIKQVRHYTDWPAITFTLCRKSSHLLVHEINSALGFIVQLDCRWLLIVACHRGSSRQCTGIEEKYRLIAFVPKATQKLLSGCIVSLIASTSPCSDLRDWWDAPAIWRRVPTNVVLFCSKWSANSSDVNQLSTVMFRPSLRNGCASWITIASAWEEQ